MNNKNRVSFVRKRKEESTKATTKVTKAPCIGRTSIATSSSAICGGHSGVGGGGDGRPTRTTTIKTSASVRSLPPPKSPAFRLTLRRKATKKSPSVSKNRSMKQNDNNKAVVIEEDINEEYYDKKNGVLKRTTATRMKNPDGSCSTQRHKERVSLYSKMYLPKKKKNNSSSIHNNSNSNNNKKMASTTTIPKVKQ
jgi:hypothetical protein